MRELIYLSERKLVEQARELEIQAARSPWSGSAKARGGIPGALSGELTVARRADDRLEHDDAALEALLAKVEGRLAPRLPQLDEGPLSIDRLDAFAFRRDLAFGIGSRDEDQSIKALVMVDEVALPHDGVRPGLMLHGAERHVRAQYGGDLGGSRSGSGTGALFQWFRDVEERLDERPSETIAQLRDGRMKGAEGKDRSAVQMYGMFTHADGMRRLPQLVHGATCEGIAIATHVAVTDTFAVVIGSPLYVRAVSTPVSHGPPVPAERPARRRLFGRAHR